MKTPTILRRCWPVCLLLSAFSFQLSTFAQSTAFTYQGRLNDGAGPATGLYDLRFALYDLSSGGTQQGPIQVKALTDVTNGLFTVKLDFGNQFPGADRWLEIQVRTNGGSVFTVLAPRQLVTATPYAITSINAGTAATVSGNIPVGQVTGTIPLAQLPAGLVTNGASGVNINGTFNGNGAGVTNVDLALNSGGSIRLGSGSFALRATLSVGAAPTSVTAADVNGDGKPDLIAAHGNLSVLTNNGSGGFVLSSSPATGSAYSIVAADVNGDGKPDLISANPGPGSLTVLTNNGSGGFVVSSSPSAGTQPYFCTVADVNGDGRPDLISANNNFAGTLTVLTNNGNGGYVLSSTLGVGAKPVSITAADVNGDGKPDLISADYGGFNLSVLTNNGSGGFVTASSPGLGTGPICVRAADVNGDGRLDLISANLDANSLSVLTNNGSGGFVLSSSPGVGTYPQSVTAADVNGDGKPDLITPNYYDFTLTVLTNNGSGGFALSSSPGVGPQPISVTAVDVNGDGKPDLISANQSASTLSVLFQTTEFNGVFVGTGQFTSATLGSASFGASLSQKLNLYSTSFGIGIQNSTLYSRVGTGCAFAWYAGGTHSNGPLDNGGGATLMVLGGGGLSVNGTFVSASDRNLKQDFSEVDSRSVLEKVAQLPIQTWAYKNDPGTKHLGPMAQDFYAAFGVGPDDKHITTVDESGVALAAIQGLNQKLDETRAENADLKARLEKLEQLLNHKLNGGAK